ncbi:hypothetical protein ACLOJK_037418 [Asimina triloba]
MMMETSTCFLPFNLCRSLTFDAKLPVDFYYYRSGFGCCDDRLDFEDVLSDFKIWVWGSRCPPSNAVVDVTMAAQDREDENREEEDRRCHDQR